MLNAKNQFPWIIFGILMLFVACEEISILDKFGGGIEFLKNINIQLESNIHNLAILNDLNQPIQIIFNLILGYFNQKIYPNNNFLPSRYLSLYFLFPALFYTFFIFSLNENVMKMPYHHEIFEFLTSTGIFFHCLEKFKKNYI